MKELVVTHKFDLKSNMDEVKSSIAETIAKYDVVVVEDRLGEAKDLMATFNKEKKAFSDKCKSFLSVISAPLDDFKKTQKEIEKMYDEGRAKIAAQVEAFEAKKLEEIKTVLTAYKNDACISRDIDIQSVTIDDLVKLTAVNNNKSGYSIAKATAEIIDSRIQTIENQILKAKLEAEEKAKRDREIAEKARIEAEERARQREIEQQARFEREKQEAVERARIEEQQKVQTAQPTPQRQPEPEPTTEPLPKRDDGKRVFVITATFEVLAPEQTPHDKIANKLQSMIEEVGITTLTKIEVR